MPQSRGLRFPPHSCFTSSHQDRKDFIHPHTSTGVVSAGNCCTNSACVCICTHTKIKYLCIYKNIFIYASINKKVLGSKTLSQEAGISSWHWLFTTFFTSDLGASAPVTRLQSRTNRFKVQLNSWLHQGDRTKKTPSHLDVHLVTKGSVPSRR